MKYIQYFGRDLNGDLMEACGDRAVIVVDGRERSESIGAFAALEGAKRGFSAWAIFQGESFTRSQKISGPHTIYKTPADKTAASATHGN